MIKLGIAMIIFALVCLIGAFALPDVLTPLAPLYCHPGETLTRSTFTFSIPGETSISFYYHCANQDGIETRDVSQQVTWSVLGVFLVVELGGVGILTRGSRRKAQLEDATSFERTSRIPKQLKLSRQGSTITLAERLRQLQEAHSQGLIDDHEYQALRQQALDILE